MMVKKYDFSDDEWYEFKDMSINLGYNKNKAQRDISLSFWA